MLLKILSTKLEALTNKCLICGNYVEASLNNLLTSNNKVCDICLSKLEPNVKHIRIDGVRGIVLLNYNEFVKTVILQIKANYDYELARHILIPFKNFLFEKYNKFALVPIPSTSKSNLRRGFNHVEAIFSVLGIAITPILEKSSQYKQSSAKFKDRNEIVKNIKLKIKHEVPSKVVIIDDIITSGASLRTCINILRENNVNNISFIIFANNCRKMKQNKD
jgi:competence protein ComFC